MKIAFYHSDKPRERLLADAFIDGLRDTPDTGVKVPLGSGFVDCDVACMVGVKSRALFQECWGRGIHTLYFDKGYLRHSVKGSVKVWQYWRVAVDAHHPTAFVSSARCNSDRFDNLHLSFAPWRTGNKVLIAGSSQKYHDFYGLFDPTRWASKLAKDLRKETGAPIVYRPKPSWRGAEPIAGTEYSAGDQGIHDALSDCGVLVTHGSNACFEATLSGVPCIILGDGVGKAISSTSVADVNRPYLATDDERYRWLSNLAYCQWSLPEMAKGKMWKFIRPQIYGDA